MVVTTTDGLSEHVRLYNRASKVLLAVPSGRFEKKRGISGTTKWSVQDQGRFVLFYQR